MISQKKLSIASCGLRRKLKIAFYLTSVLPVLVTVYLVSLYVVPRLGFQLPILLYIFISAAFSLFGFFIIKEVVDRIVLVTSEAKLIAAGALDRRVTTAYEDEISDLGNALNQLTKRIRMNMDELKTYGERTTEINLEIEKRVLILSSLLQISSLISQSAKLEEILKVIMGKAHLLAQSEASFFLMKEDGQNRLMIKAAGGPNAALFLKLSLEPAENIFEGVFKFGRALVVDRDNALLSPGAPEVLNKIMLKNILALPVLLKGKVTGALIIGNKREQFAFAKDDKELLDIFAKQVSLALENDLLVHKVESLEIKDALTGLYNEKFIRNRLGEEIKRAIAYQRPCSLIILNVDNFRVFHNAFGTLEAEATLKKIASLIKDSVTEIERVARIGDNEFVILAPEKNKRQAQEIAEYIRRKVEFTFGEEPDPQRRLTISGGVSENPLDGIECQALFGKAGELLTSAKTQGKNCIIGFKERAACP